MSKDTIYREDAIRVASKECHEFRGIFGRIEERIKELPSADRPQGEWIVNIFDYKSMCSVCGANETHFIYGTEMWYGLGKSKFCPYCGARMKGADDETEMS